MLTKDELFKKVDDLVSVKGNFVSNLLEDNRIKPIATKEFLVASMLPGALYLFIWKDYYSNFESAEFKYTLSNELIEQTYLLDLSQPPDEFLVANYRLSKVLELQISVYSSELGQQSKIDSLSEEINSVMFERSWDRRWTWNGWESENLVVYDLTDLISLTVPSLNFPKGGI